MRNRERYITRRNEYDLMKEIRKNTHTCPIFVISGKHPRVYHMYGCAQGEQKCDNCIQSWLNKEEGLYDNNYQ